MDRRGFLIRGGVAAASAAGLLAHPGMARAADRTLGVQDWMSSHSDGTPLQTLTIPGTHDSGARFGGLWVECQDLVVADQLGAGIRFLDVRCRITGDAFAIHHAAFYQNLMFGDVLVACRDFLAAHPTETVLMRVKQEYSEESDAAFRRVFDLYLDQKGWRSLFHIDSTLPSLGQARGKVVLLADNGGLPGVRYGDAAHFDIQDDWNAEPFAKRPKIEAQFRKAAAEPGKLFVNYVSTAAGLPPDWNADRLNPQVRGFLDGTEMAGRTGLGVVVTDFPEQASGLIDAILRHNP
ncbi:phosphatidylinositol-specific phospholipase C [Streptomyces beijiangensis]|uniref:1-phosphatidylinositol phosphodiesterase n=1 Tax=Streptomyces beijiangensis TaxID=163361 RepID=A0A939JHQ7_9ACTN|nr:phosphatidylinositol-specific phospholipase C [Streptomyces beijiangensis]MBO0512360.1 phosphatidylinositol-specific phospholipase C [Streptomyces beijiangensis]